METGQRALFARAKRKVIEQDGARRKRATVEDILFLSENKTVRSAATIVRSYWG